MSSRLALGSHLTAGICSTLDARPVTDGLVRHSARVLALSSGAGQEACSGASLAGWAPCVLADLMGMS